MTAIPRRLIVEKIRERLSIDSDNEEEMIVCKHQNISVCSYCFFLKAARVLEEMNASPEFIESFNAMFNYAQVEA